MRIFSYWLWQMPETVSGTAFVIDVYAATTNIAIMMQKKVNRLLLVDAESADHAKRRYPEAIMIGESYRFSNNFYTYGNNPVVIRDADIAGKDVLYMSINGTRAIGEALHRGAGQVYALSFVNMAAAISLARDGRADMVSVIMSGDEGMETAEDRLCAETFAALLHGIPVDYEKVDAESTAFAASFYGKDPIDESIRLPLAHDSIPIVPGCAENSDGFIEVRA